MSQPVTRRIEDATPFHAGTDRTMAVLSLAVAVGVVFWFKLPLNFDVNSPEFNPMVFLPVVLVLYGVAQAFKSVRGRGIVNRFGASVFEMQGNAVSVGQTLRGRVVTSRDLIATSGFRLRLRCIEEVSYAQSAGSAGDRRRDVIRWEAESTVEAAESGSDGVPVEFAIPRNPGTRDDGAFSGRVRWTLEVEATVDGARYEALFGVPVTTPPAA